MAGSKRRAIPARTLNRRVGATHVSSSDTPKEFTRSDGRVGAGQLASIDTPKKFTRSDGRVGATGSGSSDTPKESIRSDDRVGAATFSSIDTPVRARVLTDGTLQVRVATVAAVANTSGVISIRHRAGY